MVNKGNFDIERQCPQLYIYIFTVITSILVTMKYGVERRETIATILSGIIMTIMLMGMNYCDWTFQWFTWLIASIYILIAISNIIILFGKETENA